MLKQIQLKISKIKYSGDSVGDDIRIEVECLDKFVGLNKKLKCGSEREVGNDVGIFFADGTSFALPVDIKIIERDLIFNDVGSKKMDFKVNLKSDSPQSIVCKIEVQESRNFKGIYDIEIPDYSHSGGHNYSEAKLATVWFLIGHEGERYFHLGKYSRGCMTLTEIHRWDELCKILLKARKGDGKSIGTLEVID